jgi:hypothetical protein
MSAGYPLPVHLTLDPIWKLKEIMPIYYFADLFGVTCGTVSILISIQISTLKATRINQQNRFQPVCGPTNHELEPKGYRRMKMPTNLFHDYPKPMLK